MNKTILIAEDSPTQLEQLRYILESSGYKALVAKNGLQALEELKRQTPALIISDIVMPELDGYSLCRMVKEDPRLKHIPVMLLTNLSDPQDVISGLQAGADNFLTKPYNAEFLLSRINYILLNTELRATGHATDLGINIVFGGKTYFINSDRMQIIDLLLSTYENAIQKNGELAEANKQLLQMHQEIARKNTELEKLNEEKNRFLRMAAHDLRNPISAIVSFSSMLLESTASRLTGEEYEFMGIVNQSGEFVLNLLNDLLDVSVIESGKLQLNIAPFDLVKELRDCIIMNKVLADKKGIKLILDTELTSFSFAADQIKIGQVINNLLSNAVKYSYHNSEVVVFLKDEESNISISVQDNGQGIPADELSKLFQPFAKTSVRSTGGERSTGLGLSIVKKIVEEHGGTISVDSTVGLGSEFFVLLPKVVKAKV